jgi:hypothetical protein
MPVPAFTLRIRDRAGDDSHWQEEHVVAPTLADALAQARERFGEERVLAIAQDLDDAGSEAHGEPADVAAVAPVELSVPEPRIVHAPSAFADYAAAAGAPYAMARAPMPWEGRWRPSVLVWSGAIAGLLLFAAWYQFGTPARDRFVTAAPVTADRAPGLALDGDAPRGGVLAATGLPVRRADGSVDLGTVVGEAAASLPRDEDDDEDSVADEGDYAPDDPEVRAIGTLVGELFSRMPDEADEADAPPYRTAQPREIVGEPQAALPPPTIAAREPSVLQAYYVGVDRGGGIMETLRVSAYDADHARQIVAQLPERPIIVRGPTTRLDW